MVGEVIGKSKNIDTYLENIECNDNELFNYDNYTYNIELCMLPADIYKTVTDYDSLKKNLIHKLTIVNTTSTTNITIDSMETTSYLRNDATTSPTQTITQEITLRINERMGISFTDQLRLAASVYGYADGYVSMPMVLIIGFIGYNKDSGKPEKIGDDILLQVRFQDVKTKIEQNLTSYTMSLVANYDTSYINDIKPLDGLGELSFKVSSAKEINKQLKKALEEHCKKKILQTMTEEQFNKLYGTTMPIEINIDDLEYNDSIKNIKVVTENKVTENKVIENKIDSTDSINYIITDDVVNQTTNFRLKTQNEYITKFDDRSVQEIVNDTKQLAAKENELLSNNLNKTPTPWAKKDTFNAAEFLDNAGFHDLATNIAIDEQAHQQFSLEMAEAYALLPDGDE